MNFQLITDDTALNTLCIELKQHKWLAVDTEFMRQDTFFAQLALIQIATPTLAVYIIDPLSIKNLIPLWQLFSNTNITKVFHAARQDLEILYQQAECMPLPIFDTQIASVFLGLGDQASYARLIEKLCGENINKDQARTQWLDRPLLDEQLEYAAADVWHLAQAYPILLKSLTPTQRQAIQADFNNLTDPSLYRTEPAQAWLRMKPSSSLSNKQLGLLKHLAAWREEQAVTLNQPRKWIVNDEALIQLAKRPVREVQDLHKLNQFDGETIRQHGESLIRVLDKAMQDAENWPVAQKPITLSHEQQIVLQVLHAISQQVAHEQGIHLPNLTNKHELTALLLQQPSQLNHGWRELLLGKLLKQFINGQSHLRLVHKNKHEQPKLSLSTSAVDI
ncbi:ribonuclease D [Thiomicrospira aerophila AL3]|uniref:Ribonuclease D n=1 Tax=Thiomicrospira aerophila AL3 TaxID=717772 RepID=W0DUP9_9GAMM|nr:ribonuclease D [Thiomicrospira aerophila]AHF00694.1 ribonuclease D [Thiomicrospira aerophila AL3]